MPCVDESYKAIFDAFQSIRHAFILTPGDNDWSDCWPLKAKKVDPLELLAKIRTMYFPEGKSLGHKPIAVHNQSADPKSSKFRENLLWSMGGALFVTVHIVGVNDNFGRTPEMDAEHNERKAANTAWLKQAFAEAKATKSHGLVILTQANPGFDRLAGQLQDAVRPPLHSAWTAGAEHAPGLRRLPAYALGGARDLR